MQQSTKTPKRLKDRKDRAIRDTVLDNKTLSILQSLERNKFLRDLSGVLAAGKESNVYTCYLAPNLFSKLIFSKRKSKKQKIAANESSVFSKTIDTLLMNLLVPLDLTQSEKEIFSSIDSLNQQQKTELMFLLKYKNINLIDLNENSRLMVPSAVKIYQTSKMEFKKRLKYLITEERFKTFCHKNPRKLVKIWAEKEVRNMKRLLKKKVPTVVPLYLKRNVFIMSCLNQIQCFCMLKNIETQYDFSTKLQNSLNCECFEESFEIFCDKEKNNLGQDFNVCSETKVYSKKQDDNCSIDKSVQNIIPDFSKSAGLPTVMKVGSSNITGLEKQQICSSQSDCIPNLQSTGENGVLENFSQKTSKTCSHILFNAAPKLKDFKTQHRGVFVDLYFQAIKIIKDMYQKCSLIHSDFSEYNLLVTENHLDPKSFCSNSKHHLSLEHLLEEKSGFCLSKKEKRFFCKQKKEGSDKQETGVIDLSSNQSDKFTHISAHKSGCFLINRNEKIFLPRYSLYVIDLGQAVDTNHIFADEFLIKDINQVNSFFSKHGVSTFFINDLFVEITGKYLPSAFKNHSLTEKVFIPNCLEEINNVDDLEPFSKFDRNFKNNKLINSNCQVIHTQPSRNTGEYLQPQDSHSNNNSVCDLKHKSIVDVMTSRIDQLYIQNNSKTKNEIPISQTILTANRSEKQSTQRIENLDEDYDEKYTKDEFIQRSFEFLNIQKDSKQSFRDFPDLESQKRSVFPNISQFKCQTISKNDESTKYAHSSQSQNEDLKTYSISHSSLPESQFSEEIVQNLNIHSKNSFKSSGSELTKAVFTQKAVLNDRTVEDSDLLEDNNVSSDRFSNISLENGDQEQIILDSKNKPPSIPKNSTDECLDVANAQADQNDVVAGLKNKNEIIKALRKETKEIRREKRKTKMPKKVKKKAEAAHKRRK